MARSPDRKRGLAHLLVAKLALPSEPVQIQNCELNSDLADAAHAFAQASPFQDHKGLKMYVPPHFAEPSTEALHQLIKEHPLGVLITNGRSGLDANHIPFELSSDQAALGVLHSHVARVNPVWQDIATGDEVLVVFRAAHSYISPNWYPSKHEFHKQVPTWNYMVAHAYGRAKIHDDERYVRTMVARLTRTHESKQPAPWKMGDSPKEFIDMMVKAIVGIEIEITRLVGKSKLGQNKEERDIRGAGEKLKENGEHIIGDAMLLAAAEKAAGKAG